MQSKFKTGDIHLVRFHPSFGSELKRFRPAVIVSSKITEVDSRFTLIAPFTTSLKRKKSNFELPIKADCLDKPSRLLLWYLRTVDIERIETKIGQLKPAEVEKMKKMVASIIS